MLGLLVAMVVGAILGATVYAIAYNEGVKSIMDTIEPASAEIVRPTKWGEYAKAKNKRTWLERRIEKTSYDTPY